MILEVDYIHINRRIKCYQTITSDACTTIKTKAPYNKKTSKTRNVTAPGCSVTIWWIHVSEEGIFGDPVHIPVM